MHEHALPDPAPHDLPRRVAAPAGAALTALLTAPLAAQMDWTLDAAGPAARAGHAMAFDGSRARVVLFGGNDASFAYSAETWEHDGTGWVLRAPAASPAARTATALAWDAARARVVLFGGADGSASFHAFQDTWEWDGTAWTQRNPATSPAARYYHALAFDSARGRVVLFGGQAVGAETWEWDGAAWLLRTSPASPGARAGLGMAYDSARGCCVLFGGRAGTTNLADTWEWNGANWTQRTPAASPPGRVNLALAYDDGRARTVLFGGLVGGNVASDTWEWDGTAWTQRSTASVPPARYVHAMAYDAARLRTIAFGGYGTGSQLADTRRYSPVTPPTSTVIGSGCAGSAGTPALSCAPPAYAGGSCLLAVSSAPAGAAVLFALGLSAVITTSGVPLPLSLASLGLPCTLYVDPAVIVFAFAGPGGDAAHAIAIPGGTAFVGVALYGQAGIADPAAAGGFTLSNACGHTIGGS